MKSYALALLTALLALPALAQDRPNDGLFLRSDPPGGYEYGTEAVDGAPDNSTFLQGVTSRLILYDLKDRGILSTALPAERFRGKRVRVSTRLKTQNAGYTHAWSDSDYSGGATCGISTWKGKTFLTGTSGPLLSGTRDWTDCTVIVQVPASAERVEFRIYLRGIGKVWSDGYRVTPADGPASKVDMIEGWHLSALRPQDQYEIGLDDHAGPSGGEAIYLRANTVAPGDSKGDISRCDNANSYAGKDVRLTAHVKAVNVRGVNVPGVPGVDVKDAHAGVLLWMRADAGSKLAILSIGFRSPAQRPGGTWTWC